MGGAVPGWLRSLSRAWARFDLERELAPGASARALAHLARVRRVPRDLVALLAWHDGSRGRVVDGDYDLLSSTAIARACWRMDALAADFEDTWAPDQWWSRAWIPFLMFDAGSKMICVDADGRVVLYLASSPSRPILHGSLRGWATAVAAIWDSLPASLAAADRPAAFGTRSAQRVRRAADPGFPIAKRARRRPRRRATSPAPTDREAAAFTRGAYEWRIERVGAAIRTYSEHGHAGHYHDRAFPTAERAHTFYAAQVRGKLRAGYTQS